MLCVPSQKLYIDNYINMASIIIESMVLGRWMEAGEPHAYTWGDSGRNWCELA